MNEDKLPPHCEVAEWRLLACALEKPDILPDIDPSPFYCLEPQTILARARELHQHGIDDPQIPVLMELSRSSTDLFARMQQELADLPSAANWTAYRDEVEESAGKRAAIQLAAEIGADADAGTLDPGKVIEQAKRLKNRTEKRGALTSRQCAEMLINRIEDRFNLQGKRSGLVTGFDRFDDLTDGLQAGEQTIVAARPSVGKTALACNIIDRVCLKDKHATAFVTLEMSPAAISNRLLSSWATIPMYSLRSGKVTEDGMRAFTRFTEAMKLAPLHMIDGISGMDVLQICAELRRLNRERHLKLVVIDYLQKVRPSVRHEKRTYEVGEVSGLLRALAVETNSAFLTLAQLNREPEKDKGRMPRLADLADSGQIERDADCVGLLHRNKAGADATLIIAKQRDGETGGCDLKFNGTFCRFENP